MGEEMTQEGAYSSLLGKTLLNVDRVITITKISSTATTTQKTGGRSI